MKFCLKTTVVFSDVLERVGQYMNLTEISSLHYLFKETFSACFKTSKNQAGNPKTTNPDALQLGELRIFGSRLSRAVDPIQDHSRVEAMLREGALRGRMLLEFKSWPQMLLHRYDTYVTYHILGGALKHVLFSPLFGENSHFD